MPISISEINWIAVLLAGIANMIVGGLWYSPLIAAKAWMEEAGYTEEDLKDANPKPAMIKAFAGALVTATGLAIIFAHFPEITWVTGVQVGAFLGIMVTAAGSYCNYAFEDKSNRHFLIHMGNHVVAMMVMGAIIAAW